MRNSSGNVCPMSVQCVVDLHVLYMYMVNGKLGHISKKIIESVCNNDNYKVCIHSRALYVCML